MNNMFGLTFMFLLVRVGIGLSRFGEDERRVDPPKLLLPHSSQGQVQFSIRALNGCYKWASSFPETLRVESPEEPSPSPSSPQDSECRNEATAVVGSRNDFDGTAWLTATDVRTGQILRCEGKVKRLARVKMMTQLRTLYNGDETKVELYGFDMRTTPSRPSTGSSFSGPWRARAWPSSWIPTTLGFCWARKSPSSTFRVTAATCFGREACGRAGFRSTSGCSTTRTRP